MKKQQEKNSLSLQVKLNIEVLTDKQPFDIQKFLIDKLSEIYKKLGDSGELKNFDVEVSLNDKQGSSITITYPTIIYPSYPNYPYITYSPNTSTGVLYCDTTSNSGDTNDKPY